MLDIRIRRGIHVNQPLFRWFQFLKVHCVADTGNGRLKLPRLFDPTNRAAKCLVLLLLIPAAVPLAFGFRVPRRKAPAQTAERIVTFLKECFPSAIGNPKKESNWEDLSGSHLEQMEASQWKLFLLQKRSLDMAKGITRLRPWCRLGLHRSQQPWDPTAC